MSEPARQYAQPEQTSRPQPGPLRDWLAAMRAATTPPASEERAPDSVAAAEPIAEPRASEPNGTWTPRVVAPMSTMAGAAESDVSDLMAENIMLKAKLKVEHDRYDALQAVIARELRNLRAHVEEDMRELAEMRIERDRLVAVQDETQQEIQGLRAKITADAASLNELQGERDLWAARAEALAQPIFQKR